MLRGARVVAIDDRKSDLDGIVAALHRNRIGVLPVHYKGQRSVRRCFRGVRVVFADINIIPSAANPYQQHQALASVLDRLLDPANGPWVLVAWTASPHQVTDLKIVLDNGLGRDRAPVAALGLNKSTFLKANGAFDISAIAKAIDSEVDRDPVARAIFDLEMRASDAAQDVTRAITGLANTTASSDIGQVLLAMAVAADTRTPHEPEHVFETLGPVFQDRLVRRGVSAAERNIWHEAFRAATGGKLSNSQSAKLNTTLHVDSNARAGDRGALTILPSPSEKSLEKVVGEPLSDLVFKHFVTREKAVKELKDERKRRHAKATKDATQQKLALPADDVLAAEFVSKVYWALLEIVPACDMANEKRGIRRAAVLLVVPAALGPQTVAGDFVEPLPVLELNGEPLRLFVSAKMILSPVPKGLGGRRPIGRVRDQLLDGLTQQIANSHSRLGWTWF